MSINLNGFWQSWGVVSGNTQATNEYEFWKGMVMSNGQVLNNQFDFFKYHNTTRYEWFKALQSTYPQVWDEYTFYKNTNDARIYDYYTFYRFCGTYLIGTPVTPTPTPTPTLTPVTPTPTPTNTPTPTSTPTTFNYLSIPCAGGVQTEITSNTSLILDKTYYLTFNSGLTTGCYLIIASEGGSVIDSILTKVGPYDSCVPCLATPTPTPTSTVTPTPTITPSSTPPPQYSILTEGDDFITTEAGNIIEYQH